MTVNGTKADRLKREAAKDLWRKVIEDDSIERYVTIEYRGKEVKIIFDSAEEQLAFVKEMAS